MVSAPAPIMSTVGPAPGEQNELFGCNVKQKCSLKHLYLYHIYYIHILLKL